MPEFVLGAMLPDLASMSRGRIVRVAHDDLARGIALHHRTDEAFHGSPTFVCLCATAVDALEARGVEHGSARAVAHVATELLFDGYLLEDERARAAYLGALDAGRDDAIALLIEWRPTDAIERWNTIRERLASYGIPDGYNDASFVCARLVAALRHRPRLALDDRAERIVRRWLDDAAPDVQRRSPALLLEVRAQLAALIAHSEPDGDPDK